MCWRLLEKIKGTWPMVHHCIFSQLIIFFNNLYLHMVDLTFGSASDFYGHLLLLQQPPAVVISLRPSCQFHNRGAVKSGHTI